MKKLIWLLPVLLVMLVTGCLKEDWEYPDRPTTIVPFVAESDVISISEVFDTCSLVTFDSLMESLSFIKLDTTIVFDLYNGNNPPDIQGEYILTPIETYDWNDIGLPGAGDNYPQYDTLFFRFGGDYVMDSILVYHAGDTLTQSIVLQWDFNNVDSICHAGVTLPVGFKLKNDFYDRFEYYPNGQANGSISCDIYGDVSEVDGKYKTMTQKEAFVMGKDNKFTVYFTINYSNGLVRGYVITGEMDKEHDEIDNIKVACINIEASQQTMEDRIYLYRVRGNKSAKRYDWYDQKNPKPKL